MRYLQNRTTDKGNTGNRIIQKSRKQSKHGSCLRNARGIRMENLKGYEGSWRLVPKDSCEVYKDQRNKRQESGRRDRPPARADNARGMRQNKRKRSHAASETSVSDDDSRYSSVPPEKTKKTIKKKVKITTKYPKERAESTISSYTTNSETTLSTSYTTSGASTEH